MNNKTQILLICFILAGVLAWEIVQKNKKAHKAGVVITKVNPLPDKKAWNPITNDSTSISIPDTMSYNTAIGYEALRISSTNIGAVSIPTMSGDGVGLIHIGQMAGERYATPPTQSNSSRTYYYPTRPVPIIIRRR